MLLGTYSPKLDDKGRLIIPAKFRAEFSDGVVLTRGQDRCVYLFTMGEFTRMHERMREAPVTSRQARDYLRIFLSGAQDERFDSQYRITIPQPLRIYAGLDRDLAVIGAGNRAEVWDAESWSAYLEAKEAEFSETAEEVIPGLF